MDQLKNSLAHAKSLRQVLIDLQLRPAGGNYAQIKKFIQEANLPSGHLQGQAWNKGLKQTFRPIHKLEDILTLGSHYQSYKLKKRLFSAGLKPRYCELCGWAKISNDGYLPLELDHINGDHFDNRIENLRILCPNCHSLQPTHRGRNIRKRKN